MIAEIVKNAPKHLTGNQKLEWIMFALGYRKQPDKSYISPGGTKMNWRDAMKQVEEMMLAELADLRKQEKILELRLVAKK